MLSSSPQQCLYLIINSRFFLAKKHYIYICTMLYLYASHFPGLVSQISRFLKMPAMDLLDVCRKCGLQKDSIHFIVLTRGLLAKGKERSSLSFQSKTSLDIFITLNSLKHLIGMWQEKKAVWTSWPVFLWEKPAGLKFLFFAMVIIMLEMLNSDEDKAGFRHVKMLPSLSMGSAVLWVWHCSLFWWALPFLCATCYWAVGGQSGWWQP